VNRGSIPARAPPASGKPSRRQPERRVTLTTNPHLPRPGEGRTRARVPRRLARHGSQDFPDPGVHPTTSASRVFGRNRRRRPAVSLQIRALTSPGWCVHARAASTSCETQATPCRPSTRSARPLHPCFIKALAGGQPHTLFTVVACSTFMGLAVVVARLCVFPAAPRASTPLAVLPGPVVPPPAVHLAAGDPGALQSWWIRCFTNGWLLATSLLCCGNGFPHHPECVIGGALCFFVRPGLTKPALAPAGSFPASWVGYLLLRRLGWRRNHRASRWPSSCPNPLRAGLIKTDTPAVYWLELVRPLYCRNRQRPPDCSRLTTLPTPRTQTVSGGQAAEHAPPTGTSGPPDAARAPSTRGDAFSAYPPMRLLPLAVVEAPSRRPGRNGKSSAHTSV